MKYLAGEKMPQCVIKQLAFSTLGEWSASRSSRFICGERGPGTN